MDAQWQLLQPLLPQPDRRRGGRPLVHPRRLVIDTILYVLTTGCPWRAIPHDLAPWWVASPPHAGGAPSWFTTWTADGTWARIHDMLRERLRLADGRDPQPSAAVLDSQSIKTSHGGQAIGYDAGKRIRGRKRHWGHLPLAGEWSTPAACCSKPSCTRPHCKIVTAPSGS
nr:transposase [Kineococcus vitellinus]